MSLLLEKIQPLNFSMTPLSLAGTISNAQLGTPILNYQSASVNPTAITATSITTTPTGAGATMMNLVPLAATYPLPSTGVVWFALQPNVGAATSAPIIEFGFGIGNVNSTASAAMLGIAFGGATTATGLSISLNGTSTTVDASYAPTMPFLVGLNLATGALTVVTPNGTFTPAPVAPMGSTTTINLLSLVYNSTTGTASQVLTISTTTGSSFGLTPPSGSTPLSGSVDATLPSGYALGDRYQVLTGGILVAPNGVKYDVPTNSIIEVIGTAAAPEVNITTFYQPSDITSIATLAAIPATLDYLGALPPVPVIDGLFRADYSPITQLVGTNSLNASLYIPQGTTFAVGSSGIELVGFNGSGNLTLAGRADFGVLSDVVQFENGLGIEDFYETVVQSVFPSVTGVWDSTVVPAIAARQMAGNAYAGHPAFEFIYQPQIGAGPLTESIIGLFSPLTFTSGGRAYVNISNYNAAPVAGGLCFAYLDFAAGTFVLNQNPTSVTTGTTAVSTAIPGLTLASLNNGDVFTFEVWTDGHISVYRNGVNLVNEQVLNFTPTDVYLAPFANGTGNAFSHWLLNSGQLPFKYIAPSLIPFVPVPLIDPNTIGTIMTGTLSSTSSTYTIDTRLDKTTQLTLSNNTGTVSLLLPVNSGRLLLKSKFLDEIEITITATVAGSVAVAGLASDYYGVGSVGYYKFKKNSVGQGTTNIIYTLVHKSITNPQINVQPAIWNVGSTSYTLSLSAGVDIYTVDLTNGSGSLVVQPAIAGVYPIDFTLAVLQSASATNTLTIASGASNSAGWASSSTFENAADIPPTPQPMGGTVEPQYLYFRYDAVSNIYNFVYASPKAVNLVVNNIYPSGATPATVSNGVVTFAKASVDSAVCYIPITSELRQGHNALINLLFTTTSAGAAIDFQVSSTITPPGSGPSTAVVTTTTAPAPATLGCLENYSNTTFYVNIPASSIGSLLTLTLTRLSTNANDTCAGDMQLYAIVLQQ